SVFSSQILACKRIYMKAMKTQHRQMIWGKFYFIIFLWLAVFYSQGLKCCSITLSSILSPSLSSHRGLLLHDVQRDAMAFAQTRTRPVPASCGHSQRPPPAHQQPESASSRRSQCLHPAQQTAAQPRVPPLCPHTRSPCRGSGICYLFNHRSSITSELVLS